MTELVLPLIVRIERASPPRRTDALEAAARAVLVMLTAVEPDWRAAIDAWASSRIRKVVRRARGAEWRRAEAVPGCTVLHRSAAVHVCPPVPIDGWPPELAGLQVDAPSWTMSRPPVSPTPTVR